MKGRDWGLHLSKAWRQGGGLCRLVSGVMRLSAFGFRPLQAGPRRDEAAEWRPRRLQHHSLLEA